ncbi:MAG: hypothetical protein PF690_16195 [Deltaproteobacteria bacterium]|jgi:hypothetical protein|nr:hypothetical protein [Deltaproteobacteria bacterium]
MITHQDRYIVLKSDSFLEDKKNELLLAMYEKNYQKVEQFVYNILQHIKKITKLDENSEKLLNQIHCIIEKVAPDIQDHHFLKLKNNTRVLKKFILSSTKQSKNNISYIDFLTWEQKLGLNQAQKKLIYRTAMTFQLTIGCSNFCRRCNEWALPKLRSHFSLDAIQKILDLMAEHQNDEISLYGASDPLDWEETNRGKKADINRIIKYLKNLSLEYSILTKVPRGKELLLEKLLKSNANISVSITAKNKTRIKKIENAVGKSLSKQHDLEELLIPARLDEDFISIKPSITDGYGTEITPDGAFIIIPTFTSALHPFGHKKIAITPKTNFFPIKQTGRDALLIDYFKPLKGYNLKDEIQYLDYLLDVQVESIILDNGSEQLTPPGMRSLKEYFDIFEEKPRLQRKKMTRSVIKRLKKQFLSDTNFKNMPVDKKALYLKKINIHIKLCKKNRCQTFNLAATSFFLRAVSDYTRKNPIKTKIMQFLLQDEIKHIFDTRTKLCINTPPENFFNNPKINSFEIFRFYVFSLLNNSNDRAVLEFIETSPSTYDPVADIFIPY